MNETTGFDPKRRLCPDGACTGVIGSDGRCTECGRTLGNQAAAENGSPNVFAVLDAFDAAGEVPGFSEARPGSPSPYQARADDEVLASGFDPDRRLCPDGTCVGVIGPNGACLVCGRVAG